MKNPNAIARGVEIIKKHFSEWRIPAVELPPDSVIEEAVRDIIGTDGCCLNNTHTRHYSDGYTVTCKTHDTSSTTDTGWNRW